MNASRSSCAAMSGSWLRHLIAAVLVVIFVAAVALVASAAPCAQADDTQDMYRLYNPNSGEHFYTADLSERHNLTSAGWRYEGTGWVAPVTSSTPVYRLYNANGGEHHYTPDVDERDALIVSGWSDEGIGWYSDDQKRVALHRDYNPNQFANNHNYTTSADEHGWLVSLGWRYEGVAWYGVEAGVSYNEPSGDSANNGNMPSDLDERMGGCAHNWEPIVETSTYTTVVCDACKAEFDSMEAWHAHSMSCLDNGDSSHNSPSTVQHITQKTVGYRCSKCGAVS